MIMDYTASIEDRKQAIRLLEACIAHGGDPTHPEVKPIFDVTYKDDPPWLRDIKLRSMISTNVPAMEIQLQLCKDKIAYYERCMAGEEDEWAYDTTCLYSDTTEEEKSKIDKQIRDAQPEIKSKKEQQKKKTTQHKQQKQQSEKRKPGRPKKVYEQIGIDICPTFEDVGDWEWE